MKTLRIIGIGAGDPQQLTLQAVQAMQSVDVFFLPDKGERKQQLHQMRENLCQRFIAHQNYRTVDFAMPQRAAAGSYTHNVRNWHDALRAIYEQLIQQELADGQTGAFLVWGDPAFYDGTIRVLETLRQGTPSLQLEVIPGISSIQALAARHGIPLNDVGENILITPARKLSPQWPEGIDNMVVMLDAGQHLGHLAGQDLDIFWGGNIGLAEEILISGPLSQVLHQIQAAREQLKLQQGWLMDTYLLRRRQPQR